MSAWPLDGSLYELGLRRLGYRDARDGLAPRDASEVRTRLCQSGLRLEVADDHERRVIRNVKRVEELLDIRRGRRIQILHRADWRILVGVGLKRGVQHPLGQ